jgi:hypothetical protein
VRSFLFQNKVEWVCSGLVMGSSVRIARGRASTRSRPFKCDTGYLPGPETAIIGSNIDSSPATTEPTSAEFSIPAEFHALHEAVESRLVIACRRRFGGLHSPQFGAKVELILNGKHVDCFKLKAVPEGHTDHFHRDDRPLPLDVPELAGCATIYQWSIPKHALHAANESQALVINLDPAVRWDIDFVSIICALPRSDLSPIADRLVFQFFFLVIVGGIVLAAVLKLSGLV